MKGDERAQQSLDNLQVLNVKRILQNAHHDLIDFSFDHKAECHAVNLKRPLLDLGNQFFETLKIDVLGAQNIQEIFVEHDQDRIGQNFWEWNVQLFDDLDDRIMIFVDLS